MNTMLKLLWPAYQNTRFLLSQMFSVQYNFAIVTAYNPHGKILDASQNRLLDNQLFGVINGLRVPYRPLIGCSPDLTHMEKSWAVVLDHADSMSIGRQFQQHAIYYVEQDQLSLLSCEADISPVLMGSFRERVTQIYELPEGV